MGADYMYNHLLELVTRVIKQDSLGNSIETDTINNVLGKLIHVGQTEANGAGVENSKQQIRFAIHDFEYNGEKYLHYASENPSSYLAGRYEIKSIAHGATFKSRHLGFDEIELTCEKVGD